MDSYEINNTIKSLERILRLAREIENNELVDISTEKIIKLIKLI